jgi:hypothetical protein
MCLKSASLKREIVFYCAKKQHLIEGNLLFSLKFAFAIIKAITPHQKRAGAKRKASMRRSSLELFCCDAKLFVNLIGLLFNLW